MKKIRVGWFSFTCSEDSTIIFTEILNDYYNIWKEKIEFVNARILKASGEIKDLDIAFVEGAISSPTQETELKKIRRESKVLIAVGSCAINAMPAGLRNTFGKKEREEIKFIMDRFSHLEYVEPISKFVKVDDKIPGCPMEPKKFLEVLNKYIK